MSHIVMVLGMHRSGTSLIARSLECFGASLGPNADWSGPDNPRGFAEDRDALAINEEILAHIGAHWDDPAPFDPYPFWPATLRNQIDTVVREFLARRLGAHPIFALKEPRLCRLLPAWRRALDQIGCAVSVVHVIRHPVAVAASLEKRNGMPMAQGLALWLEYTKRARVDVDPAWPSVCVHYDTFLADPVHEMTCIGRSLGLTRDDDRMTAFMTDFLDRDLRHHYPNNRVRIPDAVMDEWILAQARCR